MADSKIQNSSWFIDVLNVFTSKGRYLNPGHCLSPILSAFRMVGNGVRRRLTQLLDQLLKEQQHLDAATQVMEDRFLATGEGMQQLTVVAETLVQQSERLTCRSGANARGQEVLRAGVDLIQQQLSFVEKCQQANQHLMLRLENYTVECQKLQKCRGSLERILVPLTTVGMLYKIQSATLVGEKKVFFASLTNDISSLQKEAREAFSQNFEALEDSRNTILSAIPTLKQSLRQQISDLAQTKKRVEEAIKKQQDEMEQCARRQARLNEAARCISEAAGKAVIGIQYQDITRQKWNHVTNALREACDHAMLALRHWRLKPDSVYLFGETCRLQERQVEAIEEDLTRAQQQIGEGIQVLLDTLKTMDGECEVVRARKNRNGTVEDVVFSLEDAIKEVQGWVEKISDIAKQVTAVLNSLDKTVIGVSATLYKLSSGIGLIAVNAQVQAAHLGHECGLGVLSEHTSAAAREIQNFSLSEGGTFDRVAQDLNEIKNECKQLTDQIQTERSWLESHANGLVRELRECQMQIKAGIEDVVASLEKVHKEASAALESIDFKNAFSGEFERLRILLKNCQNATSFVVGGNVRSVAGLRESLDRLKGQYTMESERVAHAAVIECDAGAQEENQHPLSSRAKSADINKTVNSEKVMLPSCVEAGAHSSGEKLADNVELF